MQTNLFNYEDEKRINKSCLDHNVVCASNMKKIALVGEELDIYAVLNECFGEYKYKKDKDVILVNVS